jgi:acetolactate synthase regulatory subunit
MGYRFRIRHDNPIPGLNLQILRSGGEVRQGHVLGCWVQKGRETLDIFGTVAQSNNLWDAAMVALGEIAICKSYLEEHCKLLLEPVEAIRPDIILNTPEAKAIAGKIHEEMGRIRTDFFDVDCSKTGKPELEARTMGAAKNFLDSMGVSNHAAELDGKMDDLEKKMEQILDEHRGFILQQVAISNGIAGQTVIMKMVADGLTGIVEILKKQPVTPTEDMEEGERIEVEAMQEIPAFFEPYAGTSRKIGPFPQGSRVYLPGKVVEALEKNGLAKRTLPKNG